MCNRGEVVGVVYQSYFHVSITIDKDMFSREVIIIGNNVGVL